MESAKAVPENRPAATVVVTISARQSILPGPD
jgi:hypothetical protein